MEILDMWTRSLRAQSKSESTIVNYRTDADWLTFHMAGLVKAPDVDRTTTARAARIEFPIEDATRGDIEDFIVASRDQGLADATVARRYRSLQQLFNFLVDVDEIDTHPMEKMKPPKMADTEPPIISPDDMARLLEACAGKLANGGERRRNYKNTKLVEFEVRRDTALVQILRTTGVRASELMNLAVDDLNLDRQTFKVIGKGRKIRNIALLADAATALDKYLLTRRRHKLAAHPALWLARKGPLTNSGLAQMLTRRCTDAGIDKINPHAFRHTFAHNAKVGGMSDEDLMTTAGWRSPQMLQRYGRAASEERAQAAHRKMFGGGS